MIASVRGTVSAIRLDAAVIEVGGIGYLVYATPATLAGLRHGNEVRLATSYVVREDSVTLYGFVDDDEREVFEILQTVSGVGPRLAMAMLAVHSPDGLRKAVAAEDLAALKRVPGIGHKGAQRIVLELGDKLGAPAPGTDAAPQWAGNGQARADDVVAALTGLGWTAKAASDAVEAVISEADGADAAPAVLLRRALQRLGGSRG